LQRLWSGPPDAAGVRMLLISVSSPCLCLSRRLTSHSACTSRQSVRPLVCIQLGLDRNRLATISARPPAVERPRVTESWSGRSVTRCLGSFSRECTRRRVAPHCVNKCSRGRDEHRCCRLPNCTQIPAYKHRQFALSYCRRHYDHVYLSNSRKLLA